MGRDAPLCVARVLFPARPRLPLSAKAENHQGAAMARFFSSLLDNDRRRSIAKFIYTFPNIRNQCT